MGGRMTLDELQQRLGGAQLSFADKLDEGDRERLVKLFDRASQQQAEALRAASEDALKHVPALLRGTVRKLLF